MDSCSSAPSVPQQLQTLDQGLNTRHKQIEDQTNTKLPYYILLRPFKDQIKKVFS